MNAHTAAFTFVKSCSVKGLLSLQGGLKYNIDTFIGFHRETVHHSSLGGDHIHSMKQHFTIISRSNVH